MAKELNDQGICGTCIYRSNCLSIKKNLKEGDSVLDCEQFDNSASNKDDESPRLVNTFATLPCFTIKNLIPGWETEDT